MIGVRREQQKYNKPEWPCRRCASKYSTLRVHYRYILLYENDNFVFFFFTFLFFNKVGTETAARENGEEQKGEESCVREIIEKNLIHCHHLLHVL